QRLIAVEHDDGDERIFSNVAGGQIDAIPAGGEFPARVGVGFGIRQLDEVIVGSVIVVTQRRVEGKIEDRLVVQVFEHRSPLGVEDVGDRNVKIVAGEQHGVE